MAKLKGYRAVVTGASSGIGAEAAKILAELGSDLVLVARRADRLEKLASEIVKKHNVEAEPLPMDLASPDGPGNLFESATGIGSVDIVINNAGFGIYGEFSKTPWEKLAEMIGLNIGALTEITHLFLGPMLERSNPSYILNISSIGAYQPVPNYAAYAASKSYVLNFTEALAFELRKTPVKVCCFCPGGTTTEFTKVAGQSMGKAAEASMMSAERCAELGIKSMLDGRSNSIAGVVNSSVCWMTRFFPRKFNVWAANSIMNSI